MGVIAEQLGHAVRNQSVGVGITQQEQRHRCMYEGRARRVEVVARASEKRSPGGHPSFHAPPVRRDRRHGCEGDLPAHNASASGFVNHRYNRCRHEDHLDRTCRWPLVLLVWPSAFWAQAVYHILYSLWSVWGWTYMPIRYRMSTGKWKFSASGTIYNIIMNINWSRLFVLDNKTLAKIICINIAFSRAFTNDNSTRIIISR
jgi:hypothetical protein